MPTLTMTPIQFAAIPLALKALAQWVIWRREERDGKVTKVPYNPVTKKNASVTHSADWATFDEAIAAFNAGGFDGIGFVLTKQDPFTGVDLDHCLDPARGVIEPWALAIVDQLHSYTERSPSGTGLRIFVFGTLPPGRRRKGPIEFYDAERYLTLTGNHLPDTPLSIEDRHATLQLVHAEHFPSAKSNDKPSRKTTPILADDETQLALMLASKNGGKIKLLWEGDWRGEYPSQSEADAALCCHFAFWFGRDPERMDRLFRRSGLMREKWDSPRGDSSYGLDCIVNACAMVRETYQAPLAKGSVRMSDGTDSETKIAEEAEDEAKDDMSPPADDLGEFPEAAWRGPFKTYRAAMVGASEAPDTAHFTALWAVAAACLRRRAYFHYGITTYPNVYLVNYGSTGDCKTTGMRYGLRLLPDQGVKVLRGVGSAEALGDWMQQLDEGVKISHLLFIEELTTLLSRGSWEGNTLLSFLTETFDAPDRYEIPYRKDSVLVVEPTPTLLAGTTPEWLWKELREKDIHGGFGNRMFFLTGPPKLPIPLPAKPNPEALKIIREDVHRLLTLPLTELFFTPDAQAIWTEFYLAWEKTTWSELTAASVMRIPTYIVKLSMVYACLERTSLITRDQLEAAILVGNYGAKCVDRLMNRHRQVTTQGRCERRVLSVLEQHDLPSWKIHRQISGSDSAEELARALRALEATGVIREV